MNFIDVFDRFFLFLKKIFSDLRHHPSLCSKQNLCQERATQFLEDQDIQQAYPGEQECVLIGNRVGKVGDEITLL